MTLVRVDRMAQLTLPDEVRQALKVKEGDYLEAEIVKDGVLLKPLDEAARRARAWEGIVQATSRVKDLRPNPTQDPIAAEEEIAEWVKEFRREQRKSKDKS
jgi:AbrB family looped-hinge helix DNA binding protein